MDSLRRALSSSLEPCPDATHDARRRADRPSRLIRLERPPHVAHTDVGVEPDIACPPESVGHVLGADTELVSPQPSLPVRHEVVAVRVLDEAREGATDSLVTEPRR